MRPRAQTGESPQVRFQLRLSGARKMVLANLRVQHGPLVATLVEGHHEGALHAACGRSRVPGVMTTTLRVNAQELQVSTTVEENTGDASASGCRSGTSHQSIASNVAKPQPAPLKSWIDRTSTWPTAAAGP